MYRFRLIENYDKDDDIWTASDELLDDDENEDDRESC